nr:nitrile hydratase accessory protein [Mesorhizobium sp. NBSH29]
MSAPEELLPGGRAFEEPWQAEAFALVIALYERGVFSWGEWAETLSAKLHAKDVLDDGSDYYQHWLGALEALLVQKGVVQPPEINLLAAAWQRAAQATPHGKPILLENDPGS